MKTPIDIAIIIALKEEFTVLKGMLPLAPSKDIKGCGNWYEWYFNSLFGHERKALVTFIGNMGPAHAIKFTTKFLAHYSPSIVINLGLSGAISNDVKLGDVVVASLTDLYDDVGAIVDHNGIPTLKTSGLPIRTPYFTSRAEHFEFEHKEAHARWIDACGRFRENTVAQFATRIPSGLLGSTVKLRAGHIACGNVLVKSTEWKNALSDRDRKYLAVDMESAGVAFALEPDEDLNRTPILILRGISDSADSRKAELDAMGAANAGILRTWALNNTTAFLKEFLPTLEMNHRHEAEMHHQNSLPEETVGTLLIDRQQVRFLNDKVLEDHSKRGQEALDDYDHLFQFFREEREKAPRLDQLLSSVEATFQDKHVISSVSGYAGTGKSTFLTCLYLAQMQRFRSGRSQLHPIVLNLRNYIGGADKDPNADAQLIADFRGDVDAALRQGNDQRAEGLMLMIDGCDEYYRDRRQSILDTELSRQTESLTTRTRVIKIVGVGQHEPSFPGEVAAGTLTWAERDEFVQLKRMRTDSLDLRNLIEAYITLNGRNDFPDLGQQIADLIIRYGIPEIDLFILSLLEMAIRRSWTNKQTGLGALYFNYCRERIRLLRREVTLSDDQCKSIIKLLAEMVFSLYVNRSESPYQELEFQVANRDLAKEILPIIPYLHPSVKEFLIAEHAIERIVQQDKTETVRIHYIYPYGINRFVKAIVNRSPEAQRERY